MPLSAGTRLGPYEILAPIGTGGMGEVFKARDTRLDRIVAIKVSKTEFNERFEREARAVAALNHPNICTLHDVGPNYLVMEYVEGAPLKSPLPVEQALKYAAQICDALDAAHKKNITHRDLKPANILITKQGIKLLDFGLAKVGPVIKAEDATMTMALTGRGEILGTLVYMSPEQVNGEEVGPRSDIFSFGLVLYEMLTGKRAFAGKSQASVIAAILERPAPSVADIAPGALDRLLKRCLEKDPDDRWQSARDLKAELDWIATESGRIDIGSRAPSSGLPQRRWLWLSVTALFALAVILLSSVHFRETQSPADVIQFSIPSPKNSSFDNFVELSPDGKYLVYATGKEGLSTLWLRPLNSQQARPLITEASQDGIRYPFWSPDSRWIAYASAGKLKKVDVTAASPAPLVICDCVANIRGGAWSHDGVILITPNSASGIVSVPAAGGSPVPVTTLDARLEIVHRFPSFLPDGRHFLYFVGSADHSHSGAYIGDLRAKNAALRILDSDSHAVFVPRSPGNLAGHLLFVKDDSLRAIPFDAQRLKVTGEPTVIATGVDQANSRGAFSASGNGILAYWAGNRFVPPELNWYGRDGKFQAPVFAGAAFPPGALTGLSLSPGAQWLAAGLGTTIGGTDRVWLFDLSRGSLRPVSSEKNKAVMPVWSADSKRLAFGYSEAGVVNLFVQPLDQPNSPEHLLATAAPAWPTDWSQDGALLVYEIDNGAQHDLWALSVPDKKAHAWLQGPAFETQGQLAPRTANPWWMAYTSDESGRAEVYLESFTLEGHRAGRVQISTTGGSAPRWRGDGRELYYASTDGKLMAVEIRPGFAAGSLKELFALPPLTGSTIYRPHRFSVMNNGTRFIIATAPADQQTAPLSVILNWQEELRH